MIVMMLMMVIIMIMMTILMLLGHGAKGREGKTRDYPGADNRWDKGPRTKWPGAGGQGPVSKWVSR